MLAVAQFRHTFFKPTETFLYTYLTSMERVVPICITFRRINDHIFPIDAPMVELYSWRVQHRVIRRFSSYFSKIQHFSGYDIQQTYDTIDKFNVKVLHAHFGYTGSNILSIKENTRLPLVTTFYGEDVSSFVRKLEWQEVYAHLFREGDCFLVEGPYMRNRLEKLGCAPQKINVIPIAIRLGIYPFRQRKPKGKKELKSILFCGSFREKKGILDALETVRRVFEKGENIEFRIIGDGELRSQIEEYIDNNNMRSYTNLLGFQSHDRMIDEMNAADIFFHPSCTAANGDGEGGAPTTILEAQACGLPVLSTTHDDIPNIVVPGESALLASEHDIDRLSYLLKSLLSQPERWGNMGISGRSFVEKKHDVKSVIQSLEDLYYSLNEN